MWLDIVILIFVAIAIIRGMERGLVSQVVSLAAVFLGIYLAFVLSGPVSELLDKYINASPTLLRIIAFAVIVIAVAICCTLLETIVNKILKVVHLGFLNRLGGVIFAVAEILLIAALFIALFDTINDKYELASAETLGKSFFYAPLKEFADTVFPYIKNLIWNT